MRRLLTAAALVFAAATVMHSSPTAQEPAAPPQAPGPATAPPPAARAPVPSQPPPAATPPAATQPATLPPSTASPDQATQAPAAPDDPDDPERAFRRNGVVRIGQDYTLGAGEAANQVVVIFGNATIAGRVDENVVVILGTTRIGSSAAIGGDLVVIGGAAAVEQGATVGNDLVVVGSGLESPAGFMPGGEQVVIGPTLIGGRVDAIVPWLTRGLLWGRPIVPGLPWVWGIVAFFFVVYLAINALFDRPAYAAAEVLRDKPFTALGAGLLVLLLMGPAFLLLGISIIGFAVMPFLLCALVGAWILGKVSVARTLGGVLVADEPDNRPLGARAFAVGFALLCLAYMIPIVGFVAWALSGVMGLGAAALTFMAAYRRESPPAAVPPVPPVPIAPESGTFAPPVTGGDVSGAAVYAAAPATAGAVGMPPSPPMPTAVAIAFPHARFRDRLAAFILDVILVMLAVQLIDPSEEGRAFFLGLLTYHIGLWTWKQTTVGGIICQLRVVRTNGSRLTFADALVRGLSSIFSLAVAGLGVLWILRDPERQAWHDKIAGTFVVKVPRNYPV
jgi:uncharacterized RDD family membrane protein YckC